jgi:ABC-type Mn2+/Zn2+ transport system permease subunit
MFLVAPVVALLLGITGFVLANGYDYPPGQMTVALFCLLLVVVWIFRRVVNKSG